MNNEEREIKRIANIEKRKLAHRKYYWKNREKLLEKQRLNHIIYYQNNKEKVNKQKKKWEQFNPEKAKSTKDKYYQKNKILINKKSMDWRKKHPDKIREMQIKYKLSNSYIIRNLIIANFKRYEITSELIQLKREQLIFFRELKQLKRRINNGVVNGRNAGNQAIA